MIGRERWILELLVAHALQVGASQQEIALELYRNTVADRRWRPDSAAYRRRVQRLISEARRSMANPLRRWFRPRDGGMRSDRR